MEKPAKRLDLQGIRGIAIIVVVLFHFFPGIFRNGFLGVDQFFVLSGFLMCMLLKREEGKAPFDLFWTFYVKRFRRLVPLYFFFLLLATLSLYLFFPDAAIEPNRRSNVRALFFVSDQSEASWQQYYHFLSIFVDIFFHTWSLSAELQFYLMIPTVFMLAPISSQRSYYSVIAFFSFLFYSLNYCAVTSPYVFGRFWQFLIGFLVYLTNLEPQNRFITMGLKYINIIILITVTCWTRLLPIEYTRPLVTVCTGLLMLVSHEEPFLSNRVLTYIGDISYSVYLVHWPFFAYWKMTSNGNSNELFIYLLASVITAVILYETFEKWYLYQSNNRIGILVGVLFLLNVALINKDVIRDHFHHPERNTTRLDGITDAMTSDDAEEMNYQWNVNNIHNLLSPSCAYEGRRAPFGWCRHKGLPPNGKYKAVIIGNSWAANHATLVHQECNRKIKSLVQGATIGCEPFFTKWKTNLCMDDFKEFEERIKEEKPDVVFILSKFMSVGVPPRASSKLDSTYETMKNRTMKLLENISGKLYILDALPRVSTKNLAQMLKNGTNPVDIDKEILDWRGYKVARERYARLQKDCGGRCELIDYKETFFNKTTSTFRYFDDRGFSFFTSANDLSPHGLEHVRPVWTELCGKL